MRGRANQSAVGGTSPHALAFGALDVLVSRTTADTETGRAASRTPAKLAAGENQRPRHQTSSRAPSTASSREAPMEGRQAGGARQGGPGSGRALRPVAPRATTARDDRGAVP